VVVANLILSSPSAATPPATLTGQEPLAAAAAPSPDFPHHRAARSCHLRRCVLDGAVIMMPESLIAFVDEVNNRPVGKPQEQGLMNIAASFSLSYETKV
jgi:hypothetical protein